MEQASSPLVSIITVTFNAGRLLEATIQSVLQQTYPAIEYIVVDGKSSDGTLAIIQQYASQIRKWVSEPDKGIYDAMNKGLALARGEYVWFMNAGDTLFAPETLAKAMAQNPNADILYGEALYTDADGTPLGLRSEVMPHQLPENLRWQDFAYGMVVCHQAILVRKAIAPTYNLKHHYSGDIDWIIRALKASRSVHASQQILTVFRQGGFSSRNRFRSWIDRAFILHKHFGFWSNFIHHVYILHRGLRRKLREKSVKK
ncbi:MAG: glycosyltransferase [Microscillaceae bacterium]|nr:glycosyltransferase [Microscillaceae bacterium]